MIFPGMDPYLEDPRLWPGVHNAHIVYICELLQPVLMPRYIATIEERVFVEGAEQRHVIPDVTLTQTRPRASGAIGAVAEIDEPIVVEVPELEIHESYINIVDRHSRQTVVSVLEVVSPSNKFPGTGRESYLAKQREVRGSTVHLVEIDLLRSGPRVLSVPEWVARGQGEYEYLTCINRAVASRRRFDLYPRALEQRLPRITIPLASGDPDVQLDLQLAIQRTYEMGRYRDRIDYAAPCIPPLLPEQQAWARQLIELAS